MFSGRISFLFSNLTFQWKIHWLMEIVKSKMGKKNSCKIGLIGHLQFLTIYIKVRTWGKRKKQTSNNLVASQVRDGFLGLCQAWLQELNSVGEEGVLKLCKCSSLSHPPPAPALPTDGPSAFPASLPSPAPGKAEEEQTRGFTALSLQLSFVMSIKCPELCLFQMDNSAFCSSSCLFKSWM